MLLGGSAALLAGAIAVTAALDLGRPPQDAAPDREAAVAVAGDGEAAAVIRSQVAATPVTASDAGEPPPARPVDDDVPATGSKERELRDSFVRRARAEPGALETIAAAVLASDGPKSEKVALLRALDDVGSPEIVAWLERAASTLPDVSDRAGESVPSFALRFLSERAVDDSDATAALGRLAFETRDFPAGLRRRAAASYAARCPADDVALLAPRLSHEPDELVVRGVLAALVAREREPAARRLLERFGRPAAEPPVASDGGGEP